MWRGTLTRGGTKFLAWLSFGELPCPDPVFKLLLRDFLEVRWPVKLFLLWGWLAILIMLCALATPYVQSTLDPANFEQVLSSRGDVPARGEWG